MKSTLFFLFAVVFSFSVQAQEVQKQHEIGVVIGGITSKGITFRTGTEKALWRFTGLAHTGWSMTAEFGSTREELETYAISVHAGREFRKALDSQFELRYGASASFKYKIYDLVITDQDGVREEKYFNYVPGMFLIGGFNYAVAPQFILGMEVTPRVSYYTGDKNLFTREGVKAGMALQISFAYRF